MEYKSVVLFSGGLDSTTLLYRLLFEYENSVFPLSVNYGQRHEKELVSATNIVSRLRVVENLDNLAPLKKYNLPTDLLKGSSLLGDGEIPEGHYAAESMKSTVVPGRNMILLSLAVGYAQSVGAKSVYYAAHSGDHPIYPDCRPEFVSRMNETTLLGYGVSIYAPFLLYSKWQIVKEGSGLSVPYELTWSCYKGQDKHCGKCGTCVERKEAFVLAGVKDPTEYEDS